MYFISKVSHDRSNHLVSSFKIQVSRDLDSGFKIQEPWFRVHCSGFMVQGQILVKG